jgi:hypothetical protein
MITSCETVLPDYVKKQYSEDKYSICKFHRHGDSLGLKDFEAEAQSYDDKLDNSFSRARSMVKQFGLCNPWTHFVTLTLDPKKYDRYDLAKFREDVQQFIRDERKRYKRVYGPQNDDDVLASS